MRICLHTYYEISDPYIGGTQTLLIKLAKELMVLGHETFIVCSSLNSHLIIEGVNVYGIIPNQFIHLLQSKYNGVASSKFLKEAIFANYNTEEALSRLATYSFEQYSRFQADIYHLNSFVAAFANKTSIPIIAYQHENEDEFDGFWGNGSFEKFIKWTKEKNNKYHGKIQLFTASKYYANLYSSIFGLTIQAVHLGVLLNDMTYSREIKRNEYTSSCTMNPSIMILIPSRFNVKQKGQDLAIEACNILLKKGYNIELVFSGAKKSLIQELDLFRNMYKAPDIVKHVHFVCAYNMLDLYESANIVLSPERYCSYGLSISESLAIGIPTVLSNIPTYLEIASNYEHAFFFRKNDLNNLVFQLEHVIRTAAHYNYRYNEAAIDFRIDNDIRRTAIVFSQIYRSLLQ